MNYNKFVSLVKHRARLDNDAQAQKAIQATLSTLAERIYLGEAQDLAAQLPPEIGKYLLEEKTRKTFGLKDFYELVSQRESVIYPEVQRHARAVISVVSEVISPGEMEDILTQLPSEYVPLFTFGADGEYSDL